MVKNNLEIKERLFIYFPEIKEWFKPFILVEKFDDYIEYDSVDIEKKNDVEIIRCGFTIYTVKWVYAFNFVRPHKTDEDGWILPNIAEISDKYLKFNGFDEGAYDKEDFEKIMNKIMNLEGIDCLVKLDLVNLDHVIE